MNDAIAGATTLDEVMAETERAFNPPKFTLKEVANSYGNWDFKKPLAAYNGCFVQFTSSGNGVSNLKLAGTCRRLGIPYLKRLVGYSKTGSKRHPYFHPQFDGVVIYAIDLGKLTRTLFPEQYTGVIEGKRASIYNCDEPELGIGT